MGDIRAVERSRTPDEDGSGDESVSRGSGGRCAMVLSVVPQALTAFAAANHAAAEGISTASSADSAAMLNAAAAALGPIGASYLAAYGPAQANNVSAALMVGRVHE